MVTIITRPQWDARSPTSAIDLTDWSRRTGFVVHYSAANKDQTVRAIQNYHMDANKWRDIGYNWLVTVDGRVWEGRQHTWQAIGAHVQDHNTENIGVCMIGTDADVTDAAKRSIRWLYDKACELSGKNLAKRYHSYYASTSCPGNNLRNWVLAGMPVSTTGGSSMELTSVVSGVAPATVDNVLSDLEKLRNWLINLPDVTGSGFPGPGSRGDVIVRASQAILNGEAAADPEAVAELLAANDVWTQKIIDGVAEKINQQPLTIELTGTATPAAE